MKRLARFLVLTLILLSVAMLSAVTAMRFAIHGREVQVPKLIGLPLAQAEQAAGAQGLAVLVEDRFYSATVAEGAVVTQLPEEKVRVRRGGRVRVGLSLGPLRAQVPMVVGESQRAAEINIQRRGLALGTVATTRIPEQPAGEIIAQSPLPSAAGVSAPKINILVNSPEAKEEYVTPTLTGRRLADVAERITRAGFELEVITPGKGAKPAPGAVITRQAPLPGRKLRLGEKIVVEVF